MWSASTVKEKKRRKKLLTYRDKQLPKAEKYWRCGGACASHGNPDVHNDLVESSCNRNKITARLISARDEIRHVVGP